MANSEYGYWVKHFHEWAGWCYDPATETSDEGRLRGAEALAGAYLLAKSFDCRWDWEHDPDADMSWFEGTKAQKWARSRKQRSCVMRDGDGNLLASLYGIDSPDPAYRRCVEAELALEAEGQLLVVPSL